SSSSSTAGSATTGKLSKTQKKNLRKKRLKLEQEKLEQEQHQRQQQEIEEPLLKEEGVDSLSVLEDEGSKKVIAADETTSATDSTMEDPVDGGKEDKDKKALIQSILQNGGDNIEEYILKVLQNDSSSSAARIRSMIENKRKTLPDAESRSLSPPVLEEVLDNSSCPGTTSTTGRTTSIVLFQKSGKAKLQPSCSTKDVVPAEQAPARSIRDEMQEVYNASSPSGTSGRSARMRKVIGKVLLGGGKRKTRDEVLDLPVSHFGTSTEDAMMTFLINHCQEELDSMSSDEEQEKTPD
ncbi:unnamed protein product, partial [Amoebophrya sp. A120]